VTDDVEGCEHRDDCSFPFCSCGEAEEKMDDCEKERCTYPWCTCS